MFDPVIIIGAKKYWYLLWYILYFIPLVNIVFIVAFKIYMGIKSHDIVAKSPAFANEDERRGFLSGVNRAGFVFFWIFLAFFIIWLVFALTIGTAGFMSARKAAESAKSGYQFNQ